MCQVSNIEEVISHLSSKSLPDKVFEGYVEASATELHFDQILASVLGLREKYMISIMRIGGNGGNFNVFYRSRKINIILSSAIAISLVRSLYYVDG